MNNNTATGGHGSSFNEEPGERGPMSYPEILAAHKAFKMAAAGLIEKPRGVSATKWSSACDFAEQITPGLCWLLGHLGGEGGRLLDLIVRTSGPMLGGLPEPGPGDFPPLYQIVLTPAGGCPLCGIPHNPKLPHEMSPLYQQWFFSRHGRRPTLLDASAHCPEPIQGIYAAFWSAHDLWPVIPSGWHPPHWFGAQVQAMFVKCQRFL